MSEAQKPQEKTEKKEEQQLVDQTQKLSIQEVKQGELTLEERYQLILSVGEECVQPDELKALLGNPNFKGPIIAYDGFEPSGRMHIAQGILKAINVNKLTRAGVKFIFWVADWFALLNNKMGGDLEKIKVVGEYFVQTWKAAGMDMTNVEFLWAQEEINKRPNEYWMLVMDIARKNNLNRIKRCCTIMGREEKDDLSAAQIMYPCMQAADIFFLKANICQLGMDQRKVNMLAREYLDDKDAKKKYRFKPIILSHHMLMGLKEGQAKMSKSDPDSAIFMEDTEADVKRKIKSAYAPPGKVEDNPILDYTKHIIFPRNGSLTIERDEKDGGNHEYKKYEDLEADYKAEKLHPGDLKPAVTKAINAMLEPVRQHFATGEAKKLLERVKSFKVTK